MSAISEALACGKPGCPCAATAKRGTGRTHCPAHDDQSPSLSLYSGRSAVVWKCHAGCSHESVTEALRARGLLHPIRDRLGDLVAYHERKGRWFKPDCTPRLNGVGTKDMLYGLEQLAEDSDATVILVEGEKARDAGQDLVCGHAVVLGTVCGAASTPSDQVLGHLRGRRVFLWPDNDQDGRDHMARITGRLRQLGVAELRVVDWPDAPDKGDAADYAETHKSEDLYALLRQAREPDQAPATHPTGPVIVSAEALAHMDLRGPRWAVPGILIEGLVMLAAKAKIGKSWLALDIAIAVASGGRALGDLEVESGDVLYLALEDTQRRIRDRLNTLAVRPFPTRLDIATNWPKIDAGGLDHIENWLTDHPAGRLVVVDVWKRIRQTRRNGAQLYDEDYEHLAELKTLADRHGVTVLVIHHTRKAGAEDVFDEISGSGGVAAALDACLILHRSRSEADAELWITGRDVEEGHKALRFDACHWSLLGEATDVARSKERRRIIETVNAAGEPLTPVQVAEALDQPRNRIKVLMFKMHADGDLRKFPNSKYGVELTGNSGNSGNRVNRLTDETEAEDLSAVTAVNGYRRVTERLVEVPPVVLCSCGWPLPAGGKGPCANPVHAEEVTCD